MNRSILIRIATYALLLPCGVVRSQVQQRPSSQSQKGKIDSIKFKGLQSYSESQIRGASGLHEGDLVSKESLQAAADRLLQLGLFSTVNYSFRSRGENIDLTFECSEAPSVAVFFDNIPWYTDAELTGAIQKSVPLFSGRAPQEGAMVDEIAAALQKLLQQRRLSVSVAHDLITDPLTDEIIQQFRVEGANLKIDRLEFGDAAAVQSRNVQAELSRIVGKPYSRFAISIFLSEQVRHIYLDKGHLRVRFGKPEVRFSGGPPPPEAVTVVVPIEPGPVFRWNGIRWTGNRAFRSETLESLLALKANEIANGNSITAALIRVEDEYGQRGYLDAKLVPNAQFDDSKALVRYDVAITEGPQYHMGEIIITGLSVAAEKKLRAAWQISPGNVFDRKQYELLLSKLQKPSAEVFDDLPVHYSEFGHWLRPDPAHVTVDVLLDFK